MSQEVIVVIMAGGEGKRLFPLTINRAKPGVPFGGKYRIIDFPLASAMNSGFRKIYVLLQYASQSLANHIQRNWAPQAGRDGFVVGLFPKMRRPNEDKFDGTADAVWQNWDSFVNENQMSELIVVLNGDHIFKMAIDQMVAYHNEKSSDFTISATRVPVDVARGEFGVLVVDKDYRVIGFVEKSQNPPEIPGDEGFCLASMGNYVIPTGAGKQILETDANDPNSGHDFGKDIIPKIIHTHRIFAYPYETNVIEGEVKPEWRDVGTIPAYFLACMDLCEPLPDTNLYNKKWPISSGAEDKTAPAKFVPSRLVVSGSCVIDNFKKLEYCILHKYVRVEDGADLHHCVVMDYVTIGKGVCMRNTIVDKHVKIPEGTVIGYDREHDEARFVEMVTTFGEEWIVVIPESYIFSK